MRDQLTINLHQISLWPRPSVFVASAVIASVSRVFSQIRSTMASETACTYACLILHDDGIAITADKISALVKAANVNVESYWPSLFAKLCEKKNIEDLLLNVGVGGGGGAPGTIAAPVAGSGDSSAAATAPAAEEKKEEVKEESEEEGGLFGLFD